MSLDLEFVDNVAVLRFDDGKRNVFSSDVIADFNVALDEVEARSAALCWIGREGCFSAGFDIKVVAGDDPQAAAALVRLGGQLAYRVLCFPRPVVCAVTGHALALGAIMLVCADKRIGTAGDFKLGINETQIGMALPVFGYEPAAWRLSEAHRFESIVAGAIHDPDTAHAAGFLDEVVAADSVVERAMGHAARLGALPAAAYAANKLASRAIPIERVKTSL